MLIPLLKLGFTSRISQLVVGVILLTLVSGAYAAHSHWLIKPQESSSLEFESTVVTNPPPQRPRVEALPIALKRGGFVPREITRPAGTYFLSVSNMSGVPDIVLRLSREHGNTVHEARVAKERPAWRQSVHLAPGTYLLTESTHERWVCRITITTP